MEGGGCLNRGGGPSRPENPEGEGCLNRRGGPIRPKNAEGEGCLNRGGGPSSGVVLGQWVFWAYLKAILAPAESC